MKPNTNTHDNIFSNLLKEVNPIDFYDYLQIDVELKQKHTVFAVVKNLLEISKEKKWNLCTAFGDYVYLYNGSHWKQCDKKEMKDFLSEAAIKMGLPDYEAKSDNFPDKLLKQFLNNAYLKTKESPTDRVLINLLNGTFEIINGKENMKEFDPDDFITYQLPFKYNENASCPVWDKFLLRVVPDESCRKILQEFVAFIFTTWNMEKCLFLLGEGQNGKSVFMDVLTALIGEEKMLQYPLGQFNHEYSRAKLINVLVNCSSEKGTDLHPDTFKALVSMQAVQAREIYQKPFTLYNKAKFIINGNTLPKETENTDAYFRRFLIIPFEIKITEEERDIDLAKKIIASELPGVFNWMLKGLERLTVQQQFTKSEKAEKTLFEFRRQSDNVQLFLDEYPHHKTKPQKSLTDIYEKYKTFCKDDGYKAKGKNNFSKELEKKGYEKIRTKGGMYFGIQFFQRREMAL